MLRPLIVIFTSKDSLPSEPARQLSASFHRSVGTFFPELDQDRKLFDAPRWRAAGTISSASLERCWLTKFPISGCPLFLAGIGSLGRRRFGLGFLVFVELTLCGLSLNVMQLILSRFVQGVGGAMLQSSNRRWR
jgi:MFS family permease